MYRLQDFITVKQINQKISIEYRVKIQFSVSEDALRFINQLKSGECSFDNVGAYEDVLKKLIHLHYAVDIRNMLPKKAGNSRLQYYLSYYVDDPIKAIEKLKKARIAILGLGGVGTIILQNLVGNGIEQFVLVDFDKVESSNHNRQFIFKDSDVGSLKTKACSRYVKERNKDASCILINDMIENEGQIDDLIKKYHIDYLVAAIDHPRNIQSICYKAAKDNKVHFLQGGIGIDFGSYGVKADAPLQSSKYLKGPDVILGSFGPTNTIISAFMANDIIMSTLGLPTMLGGADELIIDFNSRKILKR